MTNADRIRNMNDAELLKLLFDVRDGNFDYCDEKYIGGEEAECIREDGTCNDCFESWLKRESEENGAAEPETEGCILTGADAIARISDCTLELFCAMPHFVRIISAEGDLTLNAQEVSSIRGYYEGLAAQNEAIHRTVEYGE